MTTVMLWIFFVVVTGGLLYAVGRYASLWLQVRLTGAHIGIWSLISMSLRKVDPEMIVHCKIMAVQAGLSDFTTDMLESQYLAGGNIERVTRALIVAHRAGIELDWDTAAAVDLAGRDVLKAVQLSVNPMVILCPDPADGRGNTLDGVAKDGIQLKVQVRVTVRTNLKQLIGGANIGALLQTSQAEADIRIARAHAEQRRAMAVAREQEMLALTRENEAAVVLAEAEIPSAMAAALRKGQLRVAAQAPQLQAASRSSLMEYREVKKTRFPLVSLPANSDEKRESNLGDCEENK